MDPKWRLSAVSSFSNPDTVPSKPHTPVESEAPFGATQQTQKAPKAHDLPSAHDLHIKSVVDSLNGTWKTPSTKGPFSSFTPEHEVQARQIAM